jgi:hypothetical protein
VRDGKKDGEEDGQKARKEDGEEGCEEAGQEGRKASEASRSAGARHQTAWAAQCI